MCKAVAIDELVRPHTIVQKEKSLIERTRSDIVVQWGEEKLIIEVVFTHEPSRRTWQVYRKSGIPVVIVRVKTDDDVLPLENSIDTYEGLNYPTQPCAVCEQIRVERERATDWTPRLYDRSQRALRRNDLDRQQQVRADQRRKRAWAIHQQELRSMRRRKVA